MGVGPPPAILSRSGLSFSISISGMEALLEADCNVFAHFILLEIDAFTVDGSLGGGVVHRSTA